jgi:flagellar biosynthesis/type III secretory pathway chaperone
MNTNAIEAARPEDVTLLNSLTRLLEEQINLIQHSDITGKQVEILAEQTQSLVDEISQKHLLDRKQFAEQREYIKRLYNNLSLAVMARKDETEKHLNNIRKGKKTIVAYRGNI